jgi:hypothetical protein
LKLLSKTVLLTKPVGTKTRLDYIIFIEGQDDLASTFANMIGVNLKQCQAYTMMKNMKKHFVKKYYLR